MSTDRNDGLTAKEVSFGPFRLSPYQVLLVEAGEPVHLGKVERANAQAHDIGAARRALIAELEQRCRVAAAAA